MQYTQQQIDDVVAVTGPQLFIEHVLGQYVEAVAVGMQLSYDSDGLTQREIETIQSLMP